MEHSEWHSTHPAWPVRTSKPSWQSGLMGFFSLLSALFAQMFTLSRVHFYSSHISLCLEVWWQIYTSLWNFVENYPNSLWLNKFPFDVCKVSQENKNHYVLICILCIFVLVLLWELLEHKGYILIWITSTTGTSRFSKYLLNKGMNEQSSQHPPLHMAQLHLNITVINKISTRHYFWAIYSVIYSIKSEKFPYIKYSSHQYAYKIEAKRRSKTKKSSNSLVTLLL